ncbi:hypothetical protein [Geodermatophilus sp. CPCC 205761]|uniref:hypothetical protein n=1 Tax=Geodermatophilus sp. CPCC 205761 TaxID=2936597 RepID=UPI003EEB49AA
MAIRSLTRPGRAAVATAAVLTLVLAGCGDDSGGDRGSGGDAGAGPTGGRCRASRPTTRSPRSCRRRWPRTAS